MGREISQEEYDELTPEEQNHGTYFITNGGSGENTLTIDTRLSNTSQNPIGNKAVSEQLAGNTTGTFEPGAVAASPHAVGEYFMWIGQFVKTRVAIAVGDTISLNTNVTAVNIASMLNELNTNLSMTGATANLLSDGIDFNTLMTGGIYSVPNSNISKINCPTDGNGMLLVYANYLESTQPTHPSNVTQIWLQNSANNDVYIRHGLFGSWSRWKMLQTSHDIGTFTLTVGQSATFDWGACSQISLMCYTLDMTYCTATTLCPAGMPTISAGNGFGVVFGCGGILNTATPYGIRTRVSFNVDAMGMPKIVFMDHQYDNSSISYAKLVVNYR